ncbi:MAG: hypothetical protein M0R80_14465 [Proteobacteria bacterium]|jgi:hypothetical protein|nr:hypothetical protein [Pseudomonadota bacterium]
MSSEAHVAQLQDLLERVQRNRLSLAEARSRAAEKPSEIAPPGAETAAEEVTPIEITQPIELVPSVEAAAPVEITQPIELVPPIAAVAPVDAAPVVAEKAAPAEPVFELQAVEPEPELEPLPDEPVMEASEPFAEVAAPSPVPLASPGQAELDLAPKPFAGTVTASGPVAEVSGARELQRSFALEAVLFRAWRFGREGGSR